MHYKVTYVTIQIVLCYQMYFLLMLALVSLAISLGSFSSWEEVELALDLVIMIKGVKQYRFYKFFVQLRKQVKTNK